MNSSELYFQLPGLQSYENKLMTNKLDLHSTVLHFIPLKSHPMRVAPVRFPANSPTAHCPLLRHVVTLLGSHDCRASLPPISKTFPFEATLTKFAIPCSPGPGPHVLRAVSVASEYLEGPWSTCLPAASSLHLFQLP